MAEWRADPLGIRIFRAVVVLVISAFMIFGIVSSAASLEHYRRVWQNPLQVTATVTRHESYEEDGDINFRSYVTYTANGVCYTDIRYENQDKKTELTAVGEQVQLQVSPEDPSVFISDMNVMGDMLCILSLTAMLILAMIWYNILLFCRSETHYVEPDMQTIHKDAVLTVWARMDVAVWPLFAVVFLVLKGCYGFYYSDVLWVGAGICGAIWIWCLYRNLRDTKIIKNGNYKLCRDEVTDKRCTTDSDGDLQYTIYYSSNGKTWSRCTHKKRYNMVEIGDTVLALYMPKKRNPLIHYDI